MSESESSGFGKFVPGFDFLQNLAKGASQAMPQIPGLGNWIAPTMSVEELDKRIEELKAVHFWLDQNSKALGATVQALEVQKMTLVTLKSMNFDLGELASAFKQKAAESMQAATQKAPQKAAAAEPVAEPAAAADATAPEAGETAKPAAAAGLVDPLQLWTALTQQFQHIAAGAMKEVAKATAVDASKKPAKTVAKDTANASPTPASAAAKKPAAKKPAAKKAPAKKAAVKAVAKKAPRGR